MSMPLLTLTGVDAQTDPLWMRGAVQRLVRNNGVCALEFGILRSPRAGTHNRYPDRKAVKALLGATNNSGDYAFHLCGEYARMVEEERWDALSDIIDFDQVGRVQVNLPRTATDIAFSARILLMWRFSVFIGRPVILQVRDMPFPAAPPGVHFLQDSSCGTGKVPDSWATKTDEAHRAKTPCGFAGGLAPGNVEAHIGKMRQNTANTAFWVDCETGVRDSQDWFQIKAADRMINAVNRAFADLLHPQKDPA